MAVEAETRTADNGITVVAPTGRLDVAGAPALKEAISEVAKNGPPRIVIDMEGVSFVDSTGLGTVISALKQGRGRQGELRLAAPNQPARVVLALTTLALAFPYYAAAEEAPTGLYAD